MANLLSKDRWLLDSTGTVTTLPQYVKRIRVYNTAISTAGDTLVELRRPGASVELITYKAVAAWNDISDLIEEWWHQGFAVESISANVNVVVELK